MTIVSGDDSLTLPMASVGGRGVISVLGNLLPAEIRKLTDAILAGDFAAAKAQHLKLFPLFKGMFIQTNPIPIKAAMSMAGMIENEFRLPLVPLWDEHLRSPGGDAQALRCGRQAVSRPAVGGNSDCRLVRWAGCAFSASAGDAAVQIG